MGPASFGWPLAGLQAQIQNTTLIRGVDYEAGQNEEVQHDEVKDGRLSTTHVSTSVTNARCSIEQMHCLL